MTDLAFLIPGSTLPQASPIQKWFGPMLTDVSFGIEAKTAVAEQPRVIRATRTRDHVVARLRSLARYSPGWDGEGAEAPNRSAIDDAINVVANLRSEIQFRAAPEPDGSIELIAIGPNSKAIVVLDGTQKAALFLIQPGQDPVVAEYAVPQRLGGGRDLEIALRAALA